ncbi:MAG: PQQ-binding-like beta-propeller repeat protein, partial [Myxococcota bacterium]
MLRTLLFTCLLGLGTLGLTHCTHKRVIQSPLLFGPMSKTRYPVQILALLWRRSVEPDREKIVNRWNVKVEESASVALSEDGKFVYAGSSAQRFTKFLAENGNVQWSKQLKGRISAAPTLGTKTVFVGTTSGFVSAYTVGQGKRLWRRQVEGEILASMRWRAAESSRPALLFATTSNNQVYAFNASNGKLFWRYKHEEETNNFLSIRG